MGEFSFDKGVDFAQQMIRDISVGPRLLAVYGKPNAGKTSFVETIASRFRGIGWSVANGEGVSLPVGSEELHSEEFKGLDLFLFHFCEAVPRENNLGCISVGIYNPKLHVRPFYDYDLLICNRNSVVKDYANTFSFNKNS